MKSSHFGLAPYDPSFDTHTKYADPGKLVKYVSYGIIPVVSEVPLIAHDYEAKGAAILIRFSEHPEFWAKKIIDCFLDDVTFSKLQESALKLGDSRQNIEIFQNLDQFLINQIKK
jgi:hypothetical protein